MSQSPPLVERLDCISVEKATQILDNCESAAVLLSNALKTVALNNTLKSYLGYDLADTLSPLPNTKQILTELNLFTQKRGALSFDLANWLEQALEQSLTKSQTQGLPSQTLWLKAQGHQMLIPVQLSLHTLHDEQNAPHQLLLFKDQTLNFQADAQNRLMNASYAGQFITNAKGMMTHPNYAFCAYTGINPEAFSQITYIDWLQQQVSFSMPFNQVMASLLEEKHWSGEVQLFATQNAQFYAILSLSMLVDEQGNLEHFIGVLQDITDIREAHQQIEHLAYYDKLTGLANRTLMHDRIESALINARETNTFVGLFFIDLDGFKLINDTFGHATGDQLLVEISKKLKGLIGESDTLARLSGDEFIILKNCCTQDRDSAFQDALAYGNQLIDSLDARYQFDIHSVHSSASVGICIFPVSIEKQTRADQLTSYADMAMFEAKKRGGNQTFLFERSLIAAAQQRLELIEALNHSEMDDEFQIYFQAQMDKNGHTLSAETLLRWFHPELGFVSPGKFIPVAEEGRQIIKIGLWVMHKAFIQAKAWNKKFRSIRISINISPIQFHEQSFIELIIGLIKFTQVDPKTITLELTEGVLIRNSKLALQKIQHLVSLGFEISIDDFGTGYSSLSYLQKLPIHELKIDQSFISHLPGDPDEEAIVESIIQLASTKQLKLVAEGVETEQQAKFLTERAPDVLLQGFLYSKPMPANEFEEHFVKPNQPTHSA